ncbi:MAG: hypothetical protein GX979_10360 [Firmicutes bacterium]|nr:hypothetical protein [Bacillota bacterium]
MYWQQWLQALLGLVVLLCVLEMLLPSGELAKFSKLVLGLAIMLAVLQPLSILLNQDVQVLDFAWEDSPEWAPDVQSLAERVQLAATTPFLRSNEEQVANQLEDILLSQDIVESASVQIREERRQLVVHISVHPFSPRDADRVRELVSSILNIPAERVLVEQGIE